MVFFFISLALAIDHEYFLPVSAVKYERVEEANDNLAQGKTLP